MDHISVCGFPGSLGHHERATNPLPAPLTVRPTRIDFLLDLKAHAINGDPIDSRCVATQCVILPVFD